MRENTLGDIIRSLRKRAHLTQEELAEGICSPVSISRIENGVQMPSSGVLDALLSRLGTSTYQICDIYYRTDRQLAFEARADQAAGLLRQGKPDAAKELLESLRGQANAEPLNLQYYLLLKAALELYDGQAPQTTIDTLREALAITKHDFNYREFRGVLLSVREANILSLLVVAYFRCGDLLSAIALGEELLAAMEKQKSTLKEYVIVRINVAMNLAQCLEQEHRYVEALERCNEAESLSLRTMEHALLPEIQFLKAREYHLLGDDGKCSSILNAIVPYMELIQKCDFADIVRAYAKKELHLNIP